MDQSSLRAVSGRQDGVVARWQALSGGLQDHDIDRLLRQRRWARVFEGVYVHHTGPLTPRQRAWAAVLVHWPAALAGEAALSLGSSRSSAVTPRVMEIVVRSDRRVSDPPGISTSRLGDYDAQVLSNLSPPRVRIEHAALTVASRAADPDRLVAVLGDAVQARGTTAARLIEHARSRPRLKHRRLMLEVLEDIAVGANSALERRYLRHVERPHRLPTGHRQHRVVAGRVTAYRDVDYRRFATLVELDGRLGHDGTEERWDDLERDLAATLSGSVTLRVGWRQVLEPCRLAAVVGLVLDGRGWVGTPQPCGQGCGVDARVA